MARYIFVHGTFQGGGVRSKASELLRINGHKAHTPLLSGCGYLRHSHYEGTKPNSRSDDSATDGRNRP